MGTSRKDLFRAAGILKEVIPKIEPYTKKAYEDLEKKLWKSPPTRFTTSFWCSNYPIFDTSCSRRSLYGLLNIPPAEPFSAKGRAITAMGNAAEDQIVYRWGKAGLTIGGSVAIVEGNKAAQLEVEDPETWLSGKMDAVLNLHPKYSAVLPVDVKSKDENTIKNMKKGNREFDPKHKAQVLSYIYLCNLIHEDMGWSDLGLEPARAAIIFYVDRNNPRETHEFFIEADWKLIEKANERLRSWKEAYLSDTLPERPEGWFWSKPEFECKYCEKKAIACKPDHNDNVEKLSSSKGIRWAVENSFTYDYPLSKRKVLERWSM